MAKAVFLDRDGVINPNTFNKNTGECESPYYPEDFELFPWSLQSLRNLQEYKFKLFLISNQPAYAKGKASLENLKAIQDKFHAILMKNSIQFAEYYYCYHHPQGIVPELSIECNCRKPGTFFLEEAKKKYSLDMSSSWIIGDRGADVICGQRAGVKTIMIINQKDMRRENTKRIKPNYKAKNLLKAVEIILRESDN